MASSKTGMTFPESTNTTHERADVEETVGEKLTDTATAVKQKVSDAAQHAAGRVDAKRGPAADALEDAASTLHDKAERLPGGDTVKSAAHSTAEKLESTADYIREHDVKSMVADIEGIVQRNPGPSLLVAVALGFLIGRAFRED